MVKRLTKHGNSLAVVIDREVLDLLDIDDGKQTHRRHGRVHLSEAKPGDS